MLTYDPIPWLMAQQGLPAVRARRLLRLRRHEDEEAVAALQLELARDQLADGSFEQSPIRTAGVLNLLDDLCASDPEALIAAGASYLISVLESQPGYERARYLRPGIEDGLRSVRLLWSLRGPQPTRGAGPGRAGDELLS